MKPWIISLALHVALLVVLARHETIRIFAPQQFVNEKRQKTIRIARKQSLKVDVLGLPELERRIALARDLGKPKVDETLPKPPVPEKVIPVLEKKPKAEPTPKKESKPKEPEKEEPPKKAKKAPKKMSRKRKLTSLAQRRGRILEKLRKRVGNRIKKGEATRATLGIAGEDVRSDDPFWQAFESHISNQWKIHAYLKSEALSVRFLVRFGPNGQVFEVDLIEPSTSPAYDAFVRDFLQHTLNVSLIIPSKVAPYLEHQGIEVEFQP